jgi:hypothetical protein
VNNGRSRSPVNNGVSAAAPRVAAAFTDGQGSLCVSGLEQVHREVQGQLIRRGHAATRPGLEQRPDRGVRPRRAIREPVGDRANDLPKLGPSGRTTRTRISLPLASNLTVGIALYRLPGKGTHDVRRFTCMLHSDYSIASAIESSDSTSLVGTTLGQGRHGGCAVGYTTAMRVTMRKATRLKSE